MALFRVPRPLLFIVAAALLAFPWQASAQSSLGGSPGQAQSSPVATLEAGVEIDDVQVVISGTTGDPVRDERLRAEALEAAAVGGGDIVSAASLVISLNRIRALDGVVDAGTRLETGSSGATLVIGVTLGAKPVQQAAAFPVLYRDARSMLKVTINGGIGVYSDTNAFFGNWEAFNASSPIAPGPPAGLNVTFNDVSLEPGIAGITQVGTRPLYVYGAASVVASGTLGQDIYQRNDRMYVAVEKGYGGVLWVRDKRALVNASVGRQNYTLNDGFLIHHVKGSTNVGDRRAVFLGARTAHEVSALVTARYRRAEVRGFYLNPNEYEPLESHTDFAGMNVRYDAGHGLRVDGTFIRIVNSNGRAQTPNGDRIPREGTSTLAGHLRWSNAFGAPGVFAEGEWGIQRHADADVRASAGYASVGYRFRTALWTPAFVVRYAGWSGDDPASTRYERWDPLLPAGSDEWMGGGIFSKFVSNSNLRQFRLRGFAQPGPTFNFTVDWFSYRAAETNNLGANPLLARLSSPDLGKELMFVGRTSFGRNYYLQTLASANWPGRAVRDALPNGTKTWVSLQASLYWFF